MTIQFTHHELFYFFVQNYPVLLQTIIFKHLQYIFIFFKTQCQYNIIISNLLKSNIDSNLSYLVFNIKVKLNLKMFNLCLIMNLLHNINIPLELIIYV